MIGLDRRELGDNVLDRRRRGDDCNGPGRLGWRLSQPIGPLAQHAALSTCCAHRGQATSAGFSTTVPGTVPRLNRRRQIPATAALAAARSRI